MDISECGLSFKEVEMRKHVLLLTTTAAILICGAIAASAHPPGAQTPQPKAEDGGQDGCFGYHSGMMGMMGRGMMGGGMMGGGRGVMGSLPMRIIFSLMDADGDGTVSLQEFQAAHERIFKAMDTDHDGTVTFEEMRAFMHGH
jgi:EF hand